MPKKTKVKRKLSKREALYNFLMPYVIEAEDPNYFIYDLTQEMRSIFLWGRFNMSFHLVGIRKLEAAMSKMNKRVVLDVLEDLGSKFPYTPPQSYAR